MGAIISWYTLLAVILIVLFLAGMLYFRAQGRAAQRAQHADEHRGGPVARP
jgi:hypothetical protein